MNFNSKLVKVRNVLDGDTFKTESDETIRLLRLDTPELPNESGALECKDYLTQLIDKKEVRIEWSGKDRYGRYLAEVWIDITNINDVMLRDKSHIVKLYTAPKHSDPNYVSENLLVYNPTKATEVFVHVPYRELDELDIEELDPRIKEKAMKPGAFKIGTIWLTVPPLSIDFSEQNNLFSIPTIRTSGSPYMKDGRSGFNLDISIIFPNLELINNELRHILAQLKRSPFIPVENYYLHSLIFPELHSDILPPETPYEPIELKPEEMATPETLSNVTKAWRLSNTKLDQIVKAGNVKGFDEYIDGIKKYGQISTETDINFENRIQKLNKLKDWIKNYRTIKLTDTGLTYKDQQLVLVIKRISIYTIPGFIEAVQLDLNCDVFNYFPYMNTYSFVEDLDTTDVPVFNISRSKVFKRYYRGLLYKNGAKEFPNSYPSTLAMHAIPADSAWIDKLELQYLISDSKNRILQNLENMDLALKTLQAMNSGVTPFKTPAQTFFENVVGFLTSPLFDGWERIPAMVESAGENMLQMVGEIEKAALSIKAIYEFSVESINKYFLLLDTSNQIWVRAIDLRGNPVFMKLEEYLGHGTSPQIVGLLETLIERGKKINLLDYGIETITLGTPESESVITAINASWNPKIVPIQVLSYVQPTYQHFGSSEYTLTINLQTTSPDMLRKLRIMNQKMNAMQIAQQRIYSDQKYYVENCARVLRGDFFNLLGIKHVMPGNFRFSTVEGKPGLYNISIDLIQADLFLRKYEALGSPAYFDNALLSQIINKIAVNPGKFKQFYLKILDARKHLDFQQMRSWKRGLEPLLPGFPKWSKFIYYITKPIPTNVFPNFTKYVPPTYEFLTGKFDQQLTSNAFEKIYKAAPTTALTAIAGGLLTIGPPSPGISPFGFVNTAVNATFVRLEAEVASIMVDVFKSATILYLKALLTDALKWESIPNIFDFDEAFLNKVSIALQKMNTVSTCYPDLELPDIYTKNEYTPPDFYLFQDQIYKSTIFQEATDASLKTADIINQIAKLNLVNKMGEATRSGFALAKTLKRMDIMEQQLVANQLESTTNTKELEDTGIKMLDQTKQTVELKKDILSTKLRQIGEDSGSDKNQIGRRNAGAEKEIMQNQKMYLESQLDYYDTTLKMFDFISPPRNDTQNRALKQLLKSWGVATQFSASLTETILKEAVSIENDKTLRMARAFPTFKLYFIEKDKAEWVLFDDFYSYAAVKSIQISKTRNSPIHTAIVTVSNITNVLTDISAIISETPGLNQTSQEQDVDRIMLRVGCEIMVKMGFSNDPSKLSIVFQGAIASIQPGSELTFVAQGWGAELTNPILDKHFGALGFVKHFGDLATAILTMTPGLRHFGSTYNVVEMIDEVSTVEFAGDVRKTWLSKIKNWAVGLYGIFPLIDHRDDNIWLVYNGAPSIWKELIGGKGLGFDWIIQNATTWSALQEILLYNPNFIMKILPYNEEDLQNSRVTLYIGPKDGYYQASDDAAVPYEIQENAAQQYQSKRTLWYNKVRQIECKTIPELQTILANKMGLDTFGGETGISPVLTAIISDLNSYVLKLGKTGIVITSGRRTEQENEAIGGASESQHLYGLAVDIRTQNYDQTTITKIIEYLSSYYGNKLEVVYHKGTAFHLHIGLTQTEPETFPGKNSPGSILLKKFLVQNNGMYSLHLQSTPPILFDSGGNLAQLKTYRVGDMAAESYFKRISDPNQAMGISLYDIYDWINKDEYERIYGKSTLLEPFRHGFAAFNYNEDVNPSCIAGQPGFKRACKYHFVDSYHHIVKNNIQVSIEKMYNRILLEYPVGEPKLSPNEVKPKNTSMFEMLADDDVKPEQLKTLRIFFNNIDVNRFDNFIYKIKEVIKAFESMVKKVKPSKIDIPPYAIVANAILAESLKDMYNGELVVLLDPTIDVHDTIYVYDDVNQIYGLIGVKEVYHYLSEENGAYTVIVPDLVTYCADLRKVVESSYIALAYQAAIKASLIVSLPLMAAGGVLTLAGAPVVGLPALIGGAYLGNKISGCVGIGAMNKFLGREGANIIPLWYKNMPFVAGLDGMRKDDLVVHYGDQITDFTSAIRELGGIPADIMKDEYLS